MALWKKIALIFRRRREPLGNDDLNQFHEIVEMYRRREERFKTRELEHLAIIRQLREDMPKRPRA